ncbi:helix-turn-helix domain-containing protein [Micromonosporaceae bacterium Da 78-11]
MSDDVPFAAMLRGLRLTADLTLEQLAEASGVSDRAISDMERGVSRGPRVRTVEALADALVLRPDERSALLAAARAGRGTAGPAAVGRLPMPRQVADFTGRRGELAQVAGWLAAPATGTPAPVVVINGPPGIGKTSLAVRAGLDVTADERYFVDLRGLDAEPLTPAVVLGRLIRAVAPATGALPADLDEAAALWHTLIRDRRMVLVLDNAISETQVRPLLPVDGPAVALVTSRRALGGLEGVRRLRLDPLPADDSVTLLAAILDQAGPPAAGLREIAELCVNVPLALRIAGNRLVSRPGWTAADLIARLAAEERRLDALSAGDLQIKAAFTLSYQQLSGVARRLFRRLALVPGSSTGVELAAVLVQEPVPATEDALDELVDLSLLQQGPDGRLQFHDLLRLYAGTELTREEGAADRAAAIHRRDTWLLNTALAAGRFFEPGHVPTDRAQFASSAAARDWLQSEADNWLPTLLQAAAAGHDRRVVEVAESLHWFSDGWAYWPGWVDVFLLSARSAERLGDDRLLAVHLGYAAWVHAFCLNDPEQGLVYARQALVHARKSGDLGQIGWADYYVSWALNYLDRRDEALVHAAAAVVSLRRAGDREGLPNALLQHGVTLRAAGRDDDAVPVFTEVLAVLVDPATAPPPHIARAAEVVAHNFLVDVDITAGRWAQALRRLDVALDVATRTGNHTTLMATVVRRALVHARLGDRASAQADLDTVRAMRGAIGDTIRQVGTLAGRIAEVERLLADQDPTKSSR